MKSVIYSVSKKFICVLTLLIFITSCSSNDDDNDSSIGGDFATLPQSLLKTYTGLLAYNNSDETIDIATFSGTAELISTGNKTYKINFSDGVPPINNLRFVKIGGVYVIDYSDGTQDKELYLPQEGNSLTVEVDVNGSEWGFDGE